MKVKRPGLSGEQMNRENNQEIGQLVAFYEQESDRGNNVYWSKDDLNQLIQYYADRQEEDRLLEVIEQAIACYPFTVDFYLRKADLLIGLHQNAGALEAVYAAQQLTPESLEVRLLEIECLINLGKKAQAEGLIEQLPESTDPQEQADILVIQAHLYEVEQAFERMYYLLRAALDCCPTHQRALEKLGLCMEILKRYPESVQLHQQIINDAPYTFQAWFNLAQACAYLGEYDEAIEAYEYTFIIEPRFEPAYREYIDLCFELKRYDKVLNCYDELAQKFDLDAEDLLRKGQCYQYKGQFIQARQILSQANQMDPFNDEVLFHIGACFGLEGNWHRARLFYQQALKIEDKREEYFAALGDAFFHLNRFEEAEMNFQKATEMAPEESRFWIQYASFLMEFNRVDEALLLMEEAEFEAAGAELLYCKIACLFLAGRRQEGLYLLGEALAEDFNLHATMFELIPELESDHDISYMIANYY